VLVDDASAEGLPVRAGQLVWRVKRTIVPRETSAPCFAFCGIARPEVFFTNLAEAGVRVTGTRSFRDHHAYTASDVEALYRQGQRSGAQAFVTTAKDEVNLGELAERLKPLHVPPLRMQLFSAGEPGIETICSVIRGPGTPA
jgi:tetraacyldisaccharide 4'-kinase